MEIRFSISRSPDLNCWQLKDFEGAKRWPDHLALAHMPSGRVAVVRPDPEDDAEGKAQNNLPSPADW